VPEDITRNPDGGEGLVLLVDNEPMIRELTGEMLRRLGCRVVEAPGGAEGLELFRARREDFALAIVDVVMPGMDGWETLSLLRSLRPDLPVVFTSAFDRTEVARNDHPDQPDAFLQKPFQLADLKTMVAMARKLPEV
jgi:CheY-like chemotaxis protein